MQKEDLKKVKLPDTPGVYFFHGEKNEILYVGKATSLRDRVKSYFANDLIKTRGPRVVDMVTRSAEVSFEETDSVLEALILEANYIKQYQPRANVDGKDDKSWNYVVITKEKYPRVLIARGRELDVVFPKQKRKYLFGPFPHGMQLKEALKIIRKIFPFFDTRKPVTESKSKHDIGKMLFYQQLGIYPTLTDAEAKKRYARTIRHLALFFSGKKKTLLKQLEKEMKEHARRQEFEEAHIRKRQISALRHIQDVSLIKAETKEKNDGRRPRIEAFDIAHMAGKNTVGVMTAVEHGEVKKSDYRKFIIQTVVGADDTKALKELLSRRLSHDEWTLPSIIVVDGSKAQINVAESVLDEFGYRIPVVGVVKNERHKASRLAGDKTITALYEKDIILANSEAHRFAISFHRARRGKLA